MKSSMVLLVVIFYSAMANAQQDYGAWAKKNTDGTWTAAAEAAVRSSALPMSRPKDIEKFCPGYTRHTEEEHVQFWAGLISIIARPESNFDPNTKYVEDFEDSQGNKVVSRGLLQLSIESANQSAYACGVKAAEDLHTSATNITCGVKILAHWVRKDGVIATHGSGSARGGGRYWSTLRESNGHLNELSGFTQKLAVCSTE